MTTHNSSYFRAALQIELAHLQQLPAHRTALEVSNEADVLDRTLGAANRDLAPFGFEMSGCKRREVSITLDRLGGGTYGECQCCRDEISEKRLRAVPWASLCITCQEHAEQEEVSDRLPAAA